MSIIPQNTAPTVRSFPDVAFSALKQRLSDYCELARPGIAIMTMVSVAVGFTLASPIVFDSATLVASLIGIVLLVAASSILNQCLERDTDAAMTRTANRPIASGRMSVMEAVTTATTCTMLGFILLWVRVNPATAIATLATLLFYAPIYTVLKRKTSLCTTVGAIPGAMPPVLGWLAAGGNIGVEAFALFALLFVWQFPHFLAIGWIHRNDYEAAKLKMLPDFNDNGLRTGLIASVYAAVFVPISALPTYVGVSGDIYLLMAVGFSVCYLIHTLLFAFNRTNERARRLLLVSLCCLPLLLSALVIDFLRLTAFS